MLFQDQIQRRSYSLSVEEHAAHSPDAAVARPQCSSNGGCTDRSADDASFRWDPMVGRSVTHTHYGAVDKALCAVVMEAYTSGISKSEVSRICLGLDEQV